MMYARIHPNKLSLNKIEFRMFVKSYQLNKVSKKNFLSLLRPKNEHRRRFMKRLPCMAALICLCFCISALAQTQFGTVSGRVADASGAVIANAKITLTNTATNVKRETETNSEGLFALANVSAGNYEITIEKESFRKTVQKITVAVAQRLDLDFALQVGNFQDVVTVVGETQPINTTSGDISRTVTEREIIQLPLLTRNPYALVALAPGASDTGMVTGDTRGLGLSVAGQRTSSVNFMLDGGENNNTFDASVGQVVPLDAVQEFRVQTNNMTAEFGRNAISTNAITKSGGNAFHGSAYEFYRGSALAATPFDDNANGTPKSAFVRNQFGGSVGGPIFKDKTFFFGSFEALRIRSAGTARFYVPTQDFLNAASPDTVNFINAFGGLPAANDPGVFLTARQIVENIEGVGPYEANPLLNAVTGAIIPADTRLFARTALSSQIDAGAGDPQNTYLFTGRVDHRFSESTNLFGRYAFQDGKAFDGSVSLSPYQGFNTGQTTRNQNINLTLTHTFSPRFFSETRLIYNRINQLQPLGDAPATSPCWQYDLFSATPTGDIITFPGYVPDVCSFAGIPFGGPQNIYQFYEGVTLTKGRHTFKAGGQYLHLRDNRTFGAYQNAYFDTFSMQGMLNGGVDLVISAIDPNGKVPGDTYDTTIDGAFRFPSFTRHFRYNELAFYGEDSIKLTPRFTLTLGLRYEYFGVLHSPENERFLDANLYLGAVGSGSPSNTVFEQVRDARFRRSNQLYKPDYNDFAPRIGFAWDIFGNGRTVFRGGYGLFYDRNFGNAVFNVIQNPPSYATVTLFPSPALPIRPNQFDTINAGGAALPITSSARMLDENLRTAYSAQWNATLEHDIAGKGVIASLSYLGANGYKLYSLNNLNQLGSCVLLQGIDSSQPCDPAGGVTSRLNQTGLTGMNRRGNEGLSRYHGLSAEIRSRRLGTSGLLLTGNYTWSHSIDNSSSFFGDSPFESLSGFGFRDPYNPALDRADSTNDIRHRGTISGIWEIPFAKNSKGVTGQALSGWSLTGIFTAQTGGAFTVYDATPSRCNTSFTNFCHPVIVGTVPDMTETPTPGQNPGDLPPPNTFTLYSGLQNTFQSINSFCGGDLACTANLTNLQPELLSPRNLFRTPGAWNFDMGLYKSFKLPREGMALQFRSEFFNLFNHSNLFVNTGTNVFTEGNTSVTGKRGLPPGGGKERRNIQLALRLTF
jgi:Carboxypeptidase regulatory-like domain/TonB dependent receptor